MDPVKCNRNACNTPANTVTVVFGFLLYFAAMILNLTMMESEDAFRMTLYNTNLTSPQNNDTLVCEIFCVLTLSFLVRFCFK